MQLLPTVIIVSLLGFFIALTLVLITWHWTKARERRERRQTRESSHKGTRHLTVRSGKVILASDALETASTRRPISLDFHSPQPYRLSENAEKRSSHLSQAPIVTRAEQLSSKEIDLEAQTRSRERHRHSKKVPVAPAEQLRRSSDAQSEALSANLRSDRSGSLTLPRPSIVNIERKGSGSQSRRGSVTKGKEIPEPPPKAHRGPPKLSEQVLTSPNIPGGMLERTVSGNSSTVKSGRPAPVPAPGSSALSSRVVSDSIQRPPPLFTEVNYSPHVRFAPIEDANRISFLSMTDSTGRSVASRRISAQIIAPPPSMTDLPLQIPSPPPGASDIEPEIPVQMVARLDRPPSLDIDIPHIGNLSFFDTPTPSDTSNRDLQRGPSVMSDRSVLTIASSEISSTWTIGNAEVVNIYPSVSQDKHSPTDARGLRSKYGRYPRVRRDKALPTLPKSPLSQVPPSH